MTFHKPVRRWIASAITVACTTALVLSAASVASAVEPSDPVVASGDDWSVTSTPGGYVVDLKLDQPLPIVNDAPTLIVDGHPVGLAVESADGLSLSVVTHDPAVTSASEVTKGWSSGKEDKASESPAAPVTQGDTQNLKMTEQLNALSDVAAVPDPSEPGPYTVTEAEYDFGDQATPLAAIGGIRGEVTGKMYLSSASGNRPVVILLHGRHVSCASTATDLPWPCGPGQMNIRSYLGYEGTARALATNGYNVLSIAANAINAYDNKLALDFGAQARGQLVLDTLGMLAKANAGETVSYDDVTPATASAPSTTTSRTLDDALVHATTRSDQPAAPSGITAASLKGRFDLNQVGLMGHSRGGEGVVSAATLNEALPTPYGIKAVLPLAPVDFGRMTMPDVATAVFLPYCDGDVSDQQGQHFIDDSRHAFGDDVLRSSVWIMGANHNFFNTVWTPGEYPVGGSDDWWEGDATSSCSPENATRLTAAQEYQVGVSYMTGFFRLTLGGETQFQSLFDGSVKPSTTSTSFADVRVAATQPSSETSLVTDFTSNNSLIQVSGDATAGVCTNLDGLTSAPQPLPFCSTTRGETQVPHWSPGYLAPNVPEFPVTRFLWKGASADDPTAQSSGELRISVPKEMRDLSEHTQVTIKTAPDESVPSGTDFTLAVVDGKGKAFSIRASELNPLAINRMPGGTNETLNKIVLQQLTLPTSSITGIDLTDVREVRITAGVGADGTGAGGVYLSDLAFDTPSLGAAVSQTRSTVNVAPTVVEEGAGPGTAEVAAYLSRPSTSTVTGYVSVLGSPSDTVGVGMQQVVFQPGETCTTVVVPTSGDETPSDRPSSKVTVSATNTSNAVMGANAFSNLVVREDDGVTGASELAPVGIQGDACAEYEASLAPVALGTSASTVVPGGEVDLEATGFRSGEAVLFSFGDVAAGTVTADSEGKAHQTVKVAPDSVLGPIEVVARGAGSARDARATVSVLSPTTTTLTATPASATEGDEITFTANVTETLKAVPGTPITSGSVQFFEGDVSIGTANVADGIATLRYSGFGTGKHDVTARVAETATTAQSQSDPLSVEIAAKTAPPTATPNPGVGNNSNSDTASASASRGDGILAATGTNIAIWIALSVLVLGAGIGIRIVTRRRHASQ
ncbi:Ig-like domain (group 3) [Agreia sp. VKM Ac-1783]|nr:Ig-like domain (group 3) [Agreia sp. VKM Ac-1783]